MIDSLRYLQGLVRGGLAPLIRGALGEVTLADVVAGWARRRPRALALEVGDEALSYAELEALSAAAAGWLATLGARSGDVVAVLGRNSIAYVGLLLGAARSGVTLALVHPELGGEPLRQALAAAGAAFVACEVELLEQLPTLPAALKVAGFDAQRREPFARRTRHAFAPDRAGRDLALVYTSGTTGLPKACRLPHSRVLAAACLFGAPLHDFRRGDKLLCVLPLYHGSPLMLGLGACLVTGTPLRLERRFSASELIDVARRAGATVLLYVGDLGRMLLATPTRADDRRHALRLAVGNGMDKQIWPQFQARFGIARVREFYAATESPVGLFNLSGRVGAVGNLPHAWMFGLKLVRFDAASGELLRTRDGRLQECKIDEPGELLVRARHNGLGVYHGYVDPVATQARLVHSGRGTGQLLFRTGDVLRRDRQGFYYFVERRGEGYRFRGENVSAALVERELQAQQGVSAALVSGIEMPGYDGRLGLAALVWEDGFDVSSLTDLAARLPRAALPRFVRRVAELPRTDSLKLRRGTLALEGVDPARIADELWVLSGQSYVRLTPETYRHVLSGALRL